MANGRWTVIGKPVIYTAESSALAMLEVLVNLGISIMPQSFQLLRIEGPDGLDHARFPAADPPAIPLSRRWGDAWLTAGETALARVPSAIAPHGFNWLVNPLHADARAFKVTDAGRWPWDRRLFR